MNYLEKILKVLGNKRRLAILFYLKNIKEATVGDIAGELRLSITATSRHLALLRAFDLVERDQRGLEAYYSLAKVQTRVVKNVLSELK